MTSKTSLNRVKYTIGNFTDWQHKHSFGKNPFLMIFVMKKVAKSNRKSFHGMI